MSIREDMDVTRNLEAEVERLKSLGLKELRKEWRDRLIEPPPPWISKDLLRRFLAFRLQERASGGLSPETTRHLRRIARSLQSGGGLILSPGRSLKPGTVLVREWQGVLHQVRVLEAGFEHAGARFASLSEVARKITGTRWSGPLFFGIKK